MIEIIEKELEIAKLRLEESEENNDLNAMIIWSAKVEVIENIIEKLEVSL